MLVLQSSWDKRPPAYPLLLLWGGLQFGALAQLDVRGACRRVESKTAPSAL